MQPLQNSKSFRNFAKHLFLVSRTYRERNKAKEDVDQHLHRMRKSVIRMSLTYSEIDRLKQKIANLVSLERKFSKYFKPEDRETEGLKNRISELEQELKNERESKLSAIDDYNERINELTESLNNVKHRTKYLLIERAKRHERFRALEQKINKKVDVRNYYGS